MSGAELLPAASAGNGPCRFGLAQERDQQPFPQTAVGDAECSAGPVLHDRAKDRAARQDQIGAIHPDAGNCRASEKVLAHDAVRDGEDFVALQPLD